jgi:hypothetical protein
VARLLAQLFQPPQPLGRRFVRALLALRHPPERT